MSPDERFRPPGAAARPHGATGRRSHAYTTIIAPGDGMAVAQVQHSVSKLAERLETRGGVAGRMPGHMNILIGEAKVPYDKLLDMDEVNPEFEGADIALVIGANDVASPLSYLENASMLFGDAREAVDRLKRRCGTCNAVCRDLDDP